MKSFMVAKSFTELIYGRGRQAGDQGENIIIELHSSFVPASAFVGICVDVFNPEPVQSGGPSVWVTSPLTQLHCKTTSNAGKLRGPGAAPSIRFSVNKRASVELKTRGGGGTEPRLSN